MVTWDAFLRSKVPNLEPRKRYDAVVKSFIGWRGSRPLTDATVQEYREKLLGDYAPNSLSNTIRGLFSVGTGVVGVRHDKVFI